MYSVQYGILYVAYYVYASEQKEQIMQLSCSTPSFLHIWSRSYLHYLCMSRDYLFYLVCKLLLIVCYIGARSLLDFCQVLTVLHLFHLVSVALSISNCKVFRLDYLESQPSIRLSAVNQLMIVCHHILPLPCLSPTFTVMLMLPHHHPHPHSSVIFYSPAILSSHLLH